MASPGQYPDEVFLQLTSSYLEKDIYLFPAVPEMLPILVKAENASGLPFFMVYFPQGKTLYDEGYYQSVFPDITEYA